MLVYLHTYCILCIGCKSYKECIVYRYTKKPEDTVDTKDTEDTVDAKDTNDTVNTDVHG